MRLTRDWCRVLFQEVQEDGVEEVGTFEHWCVSGPGKDVKDAVVNRFMEPPTVFGSTSGVFFPLNDKRRNADGTDRPEKIERG